jgi:hypothetical protein
MRNAPREQQSGRSDTDDIVSGASLRIVSYGERRVLWQSGIIRFIGA